MIEQYGIELFSNYYITSIFITQGAGAVGNGETIGKCPSGYSNYRCLSTGYCNICGNINNVAEGCDVLSSTPVCDADSSTGSIEDSAAQKVAQCVACKKDGELIMFCIS